MEESSVPPQTSFLTTKLIQVQVLTLIDSEDASMLFPLMSHIAAFD